MHDLADLDAIDWARPVNWSWPLNRYGLVSWYIAVPGPGRAGWKSNLWRDLCGRNRGTLTNMNPENDWVGPRGRPGGFGALDFDGSNDHINIPDSNSLDFGTGDYCIAFWFASSTSSNMGLVTKWTSLNSGVWACSLTSGGKLHLGRGVSGVGHVEHTAATTCNDGNWHHAAYTRIGTAYAIYLDGVSDFSTTATAATMDNANTLYMGRNDNGLGSPAYLNGRLDDIRLYKGRGLSAEEVKQLYNESRMGYPNGFARTALPYGYAQEAAPAGDDINDPFGLSGFFGAAA